MNSFHKQIPLLYLVCLLIAGIQVGCSSSSPSTTTKTDDSSYGYTNILEMLRKEPALRISGPTSNPQIRVTGGGRSIAGSSEPLFVVDGQVAGRGYRSIGNIDVNVVKSINVISAARAGKYGSMGGNGVIEIITK